MKKNHIYAIKKFLWSMPDFKCLILNLQFSNITIIRVPSRAEKNSRTWGSDTHNFGFF